MPRKPAISVFSVPDCICHVAAVWRQMCGKLTQLATWAEVHVFSQPLVVQSGEEGVVSSKLGDERETKFSWLLCSKLPALAK